MFEMSILAPDCDTIKTWREKPTKKRIEKMARIATGVSKKSNRQNLKALELIYVWQRQFAVTTTMTPELAFVLSDGKFGTAPVRISAMPSRYAEQGPATVDALKVALHIVKRDQLA